MPPRKTTPAAPEPSAAARDPMIEVAIPFEVPPRDPRRSSYPPPPSPDEDSSESDPAPEESETKAATLLVLLAATL